ncbi:MAG: LysR family transcriptional regulator [Rhodospirillaceae bacterium]
MFDQRDLRYVITVAEEGGFTAASRKLNVAQSAISRRISLLETELGGKLFLRRKNGVEATEAGERFITRAHEILQSMRHARDEISSLLGEPSGSVAIGVPPTAGEVLMPEVFRICRERWPNLKIKVQESYSADTYRAVLRNELDIGFVHDPVSNPELTIIPLFPEPMHFITRPDTRPPARVPISWLSEKRIILPDTPFGLRQLLETYAGEHGSPVVVASEVNGVSVTKAMVMAGLGNTVLSYSAVVSEVAAGKLVSRPLDPPLSWELCVIFRNDRAGNRSFVEVERVAEAVVQQFAKKGVLMPVR